MAKFIVLSSEQLNNDSTASKTAFRFLRGDSPDFFMGVKAWKVTPYVMQKDDVLEVPDSRFAIEEGSNDNGNFYKIVEK